ncbi:DNA-binding transcriptional LysR family regulator [Paraburkholderia unamae]|nr:DNA-binding transcriptional LysR family regulator [Paraburkholderia unamae]
MSATARELGIDVSTVSRRVSAAEKSLDVRLFTRNNLQYELTDAGKVFVAQAESIYDQIVTMMLTCADRSTDIAGSVRITAVEFLFDYWLLDHLPALQKRYPSLQIELVVSSANLSFTRREVDFALRLSRPTADAALVMRKLGEVGFAVYGASRFAALPRKEWANQPWISYSESLSGTPETHWMDQFAPNIRKNLRVSTLGTMVRACLAENGLALLPCVLGSHAGLVKLSESTETTRELWLLSHKDAGSVARFKIVSAWLSAIFQASHAKLLGADSHIA